MTKAVSFPLGFILLIAAAATAPAQSPSATSLAINRAIINQANTIVLRQKLVDAKNAAARGDLTGAAKLYEDAYTLVQQIGSGIDAEKAQTVAGFAATRLELARRAQGQGDLREADTQVSRVLKVDPQNAAALAFKQRNDKLLASTRGQRPSEQALQQAAYIANDKTAAGTLVRDAKLFYEMGKFDEAEAKLKEAVKLDPDNAGALYYMNLVRQARYERETHLHTIDTQDRMVEVENAWTKPISRGLLPAPNPYATTNLVHTGAGREAIYSKLNRIRLDKVDFGGLPLSEIIRNLTEQSKLRDPDRKGINFLINPNAQAGAAATPAGVPGATTIDATTGLPVAPAPGAPAGETVDIGSVTVKLALSDVRLADVLEAIVLVADHPIKYSVQDYAIVFSARGPEPTPLETRTFKVDPNTFYQGLESVASFVFASANLQTSGGGTSGGGGGGGQSGNTISGAVVPIINAAPGAGASRAQGGGGGGGGGGVGGGGLRYVTLTNATVDVSIAARNFFSTLGVNLDPTTPAGQGKSIFFNDRLGILFVRATSQDLDIIEMAIQALNMMPPQVHIKARFIDVLQNDNTALGFDWYLGQINMGNVVASGGSAPSLNVPVSAANPLGAFPGNTAASIIPGSSSDQLLTGGLRNSAIGAPALATVTGILTDPNFRVVLYALQQRDGTEELAEPEVTTISGRQTEVRATSIETIITGYSFQQGSGGGIVPTTTP
jgi:tetratricopeptide (TPR) repeat protein